MKISFADKLFDCLAAARMQNAGKLPEDKWKSEVNAFVERERPLNRKLKREKPLTRPDLSDAEWLAFLKSDADFKGFDVDVQFAKMRYWCRVNDVNPTRLRFLKWLGRCDKTITTDGKPPKTGDVYVEPDSDSWRKVAFRMFPRTTIHEANWFDLGTDVRAQILRAI